MFYSNSRDIQKYKKLKQDLALYRLVFGQPRQEDVVRKIRSKLGDDVSPKLLSEFLPLYMIDLSPFSFKTVWKLAVRKSRRLLSSHALKSEYISRVKEFVSCHSDQLKAGKPQIDQMIQLIERSATNGRFSHRLTNSAAALYYLINPFDETYDFYRGIGFSDDLKLIDKVHKKYFGDPRKDKALT